MQENFGGIKSFDWAIQDNSGATSTAPGFQTLKTTKVKMKETILLTKHMRDNPEDSHLIDSYEKTMGTRLQKNNLRKLS